MKKSIAVFVLSVLMALCLVGCGDGSGEPAAVQKNEDGSVNIRDNNLYYVKIDGKTYKAGAKIADIEKAGYTMSDKRRDEMLPAQRYSMDNDMKNSDGKTVFQTKALNTGSEKVKYAEAELGGFTIGSFNTSEIAEETLALNIEVYGGLKLGGSYDDIVNALGEPDFSFDHEGSDLLPAYKTYKYSSGYRGYEFIVDDGGKISQISWNNYDYNEK